MEPIYKRRGMVLWSQLSKDEVSASLDHLHEVQVQLSVDQALAVNAARRVGMSWQEVGSRLGMTKQAAWEKWRHLGMPQHLVDAGLEISGLDS